MVCTNPFTAWASARKHESVQAYERQHSPAFHSEAKTELAALPVSKTEISAQGQEAGEDAKFTPGPWKFYEFPHKDGLHMGYIRPDPEDGMEISHHGDMGRSGAENLANAHLIAAVPELYEALEGCLKPLQAFCELTRFGDEFRKANTVLAAAKKALAKARQGATHAS